uniref:uncharacterized protein LOC120342677 n=1 Tax=Styela clava TaxID=7725 RepID=UPI001939F8D4|nr:uncharacterized protein LOC120342677 [Styela clava]
MVRERKASTVHIGCTPRNLSFSGCGFLGVYHIGVASCFKQHAPEFLQNLNRLYGCSAGSIVGAMLLSDVCCGELCRSTLDIVRNVRSRYLGPLSPGFKANRVLLDGLRRVLPPDAHKKCDGRLFISLTRVRDRKNIIVSEYPTRDSLISALLCSCFVPFYSGFIPPMYQGVYYVDGGLTNNLPAGSDTITVSPWSGGSDICPRDDTAISLVDINIANTSVQMTVRNLHRVSIMFFPPEGEILSDFCKQGFREALRYLKEHGLFETINPTLRSMSFSNELAHVDMKQEQKHRLSMSSKWCALQSNASLCLKELEWEEDDVCSGSSDEDYLTMTAGTPSETSSSTSGCASSEFEMSDDDCDNNHNHENNITSSELYKVHVHNYPHLKFLPVAGVVHMSSMEDFTSLLHLNLPHVVLQALEESYLHKNSGWYFPINKMFSICGRPLVLAKMPLDKSYSLALLILKNANYIPQNFQWVLWYISTVVHHVQEHFQLKGSELITKLKTTKDNLSDEVKVLACQLCIIIQLILQKICFGKDLPDLSWALKIVGGVNTISKFSSYLT